MKTISNTQRMRRLLVGLLLMALFSTAAVGQTYKLLKAGNDKSKAKNLDDVSVVLGAIELANFYKYCSTSSVVGNANGQDYNLAQDADSCLRSHSNATQFVSKGSKWLNENKNIRMVVLNVSSTRDVIDLMGSMSELTSSKEIKYVVIRTFPELYPSTSPENYEKKGLELLTPVVTSKRLNALFDVGIRVFYTAAIYK